MGKIFTSESVTEGHPDKICDQVSDAILDSLLAKDPRARVACETVTTTGLVLVIGEVSTSAYVDISKIVRKTINEIGYRGIDGGFDGNTCAVLVSLDEQSADISIGVNNAYETKSQRKSQRTSGPAETGAGDQGMVFGYATNETSEYMPAPILFAHRLTKRLATVRKENILPYLRPDGKAQVTVEYDEAGNAHRVDTIVISTQHSEAVELDQVRNDVIRHVVKEAIPQNLLDQESKYYVNPTGRFVIGGPQGDAGVTGRKIVVDTYGGIGRHGGGAFSGKDPTKVDRSGAYAARWIAKNLVAAGVADKLELEIAYAIGVARPVSIAIDTFGTGKIPESRIIELIQSEFDLRPDAIINAFDLLRPIYKQTAVYGHFGRTDVQLPWEELNRINDILKYI